MDREEIEQWLNDHLPVNPTAFKTFLERMRGRLELNINKPYYFQVGRSAVRHGISDDRWEVQAIDGVWTVKEFDNRKWNQDEPFSQENCRHHSAFEDRCTCCGGWIN